MKNTKEIYMYILGAIVVLGFIALAIFLIWSGKYESAVNLMIGAIISSFTLVLGYFFGSSKGSADKTHLLNSKKDE